MSDKEPWKRGWFWAMLGLSAVISLGGRSLWADYVQPDTATAVGDFLMFVVILWFMASRTPPAAPPPSRLIPMVVFSAGMAAGFMALWRWILL